MGRFVLLLCCFSMILGLRAQDCPDLIVPLQGATNVPVETTISWEEVTGVNGYIISLGTTPGGTEIVDEVQIGNDPNFTPPLGLPENTRVYVTITLFFFDQDNIVCSSQFFNTENVAVPPECTFLENPLNGAENVNVATSLFWKYAVKATGYRLTLGTAAGANDILDNEDVGNQLFYDPPADFPWETTIYVTISPYNENGIALDCLEEFFTTASLGEPPTCTSLITPENGAFNVPLSPLVAWHPVENADGYRLYVGRTPYINDILDGSTFTDTSTYVFNFEPNNTYYVRIVPFNQAGEAQSCPQESFSTILGCGPFYDPDTGELITYYPESTFPDFVGICEGQTPTTIVSPDVADGYRWYRKLPTGGNELISEMRSVEISETGIYLYEVYNLIVQGGYELECPYQKEFTVTESSKPTIDNIFKEQIGDFFSVTVMVSGLGDYEYALDDGPYTANNFFLNLPEGDYYLKVRDINGCGEVEQLIRLRYQLPGFPPYFSPNGDGINDLWHYRPPNINPLPLKVIYIYDRYGKLIASVGRVSEGWDGKLDGIDMPADGYWYKAILNDGREITGHFSLVR